MGLIKYQMYSQRRPLVFWIFQKTAFVLSYGSSFLLTKFKEYQVKGLAIKTNQPNAYTELLSTYEVTLIN